jgi:hypothetical protein
LNLNFKIEKLIRNYAKEKVKFSCGEEVSEGLSLAKILMQLTSTDVTRGEKREF